MYKIFKCPICDNDKLKFVSEHAVDEKANGWSMLLDDNLRESYKINSCLCCGFVFRNLRFSDTDMDTLYGSVTAPKHRKCRYVDYYDRSLEIMDFLSINIKLRSFKGLKILDVGGGRGEVTEYFTKLGCSVDILEFDVEPMEIRENLRVIDQLMQKDYDIVIFSHILEHLTRPKEFLKSILEVVRTNAIVYIEVPYESVSYYLFNTKGHYEHLNYFNAISLKNLILLVGGDQISVQKKIGFGNSLPVISGCFFNRKLDKDVKDLHFLSPRRDALALYSLYLFFKSKLNQKFGNISRSHKPK